MISKSNASNGKKYLFRCEKRVDERVDFDLEVYYPIINNDSVYKNYDLNTPLLHAINLSESGICFKSRIPLKKGDVISFLLKVEENPSCWCFSEVKWVAYNDKQYIAGCIFYLMSYENIVKIREYVRKENRIS